MEGYVKLYRKLLDWEWYDKKNTRALFQHCLLKANYRDTSWHGIIIPSGSFITSLQTLHVELDLTVREIRTALTNLKSTSDITTKTTSDYTMINVTNWAKYQSDEIISDTPTTSGATNERQTSDKQTTTAKEDKNIRSEEVKQSTLVGDCDKLASEWNELMKGKSIPQVRIPLSQTRKSHIENRIAEHGIEVFREMMKKVLASDFCNGSKNGWIAAFDWCINPANFTKIIEGNYDNKGNGKSTNGKPDAQIGWLDGYMKEIERAS